MWDSQFITCGSLPLFEVAAGRRQRRGTARAPGRVEPHGQHPAKTDHTDQHPAKTELTDTQRAPTRGAAAATAQGRPGNN